MNSILKILSIVVIIVWLWMEEGAWQFWHFEWNSLMIWVPMYYSAYLLLLSAKHCWEMGMDVMNYFLRAES